MRIFDFDGVLMDSREETAVTGYNAVTGNTVTDLADLPAGFLDAFRRERRYARSSSDLFRLAFRLLEIGTAPRSGGLPDLDFGNIGDGGGLAPDGCSARFFAARSRFMDLAPDDWFALHRPYEPLWSALRENGPAMILTNKNREATSALCRHFGLEMAESDIYAGDGGGSKAGRLENIHRRFGHPPHEFLEDSLANLVGLDGHFGRNRDFFQPLLAAWGYLRPGDPEEAAAQGIPLLDLEAAARWVRGG